MQGVRVLSPRPAEAERSLAHVGLGDLFEPVLDEVLPALTLPRRRALEVALLRHEASGNPVDDRALAVAVRDVLQLLTERSRILIAIDDVQWLDPFSSSALAFALRRLETNPVRVLLARRLADGVRPPELEQALVAEGVQRLPVGPLTVGALHRILRDQFERPFARQTLLRIHERAGGNPLFALELGRAVDGAANPAAPFPVPHTVEELLRTRISGLPASTRRALELAAAFCTVAESMLERAGISPDALEPAEMAHVIERAHGMIRFTHPLLSSVLYQDLGDKRAGVHGQIAQIVEDSLLRARHFGLSKDASDSAVAGVLDGAVRLAVDRGATALAAELAEQAMRLTPLDASDEHYRRALAAARAHQAGGEWTRARAIATDLLSNFETGVWRAEALVFLAELEGAVRADALLEQALREAVSRPALQSVIHCRLAWVLRFRNGLDHARVALELAERLGDHELRARAHAVAAILAWFRGVAETPGDLLSLFQDIPSAVGGERLVQEAMQSIVNSLAPASKRDQARSLLESEHREWSDRDGPRSARALLPRVGRVPGRAMGACGRARRSRARHCDPVWARSAAGPPPDRCHCGASRAARHRARALAASTQSGAAAVRVLSAATPCGTRACSLLEW